MNFKLMRSHAMHHIVIKLITLITIMMFMNAASAHPDHIYSFKNEIIHSHSSIEYILLFVVIALLAFRLIKR